MPRMTATNDDEDARIEELEMRLAHQEKAVTELGDELYRQQRQIARLETALRLLAARLERAELEHAAGNPVDEVPPHY